MDADVEPAGMVLWRILNGGYPRSLYTGSKTCDQNIWKDVSAFRIQRKIIPARLLSFLVLSAHIQKNR